VTQPPQLRHLAPPHAGLLTRLDTHPVPQSPGTEPEILRDLHDHDSRSTVPDHTENILTEPLRKWPGNDDILPALPHDQTDQISPIRAAGPLLLVLCGGVIG